VSSATAEEHNEYLDHHFQNEEQQSESCTMGMWLFLAQEVMFFGAMFAAYAVMRWMYFDAFKVGSASLDYVLGGVNTVVLLVSSFSAAMAVYSAQTGNNKRVVRWLGATLALGCLFLYIKWAYEWPPKFAYNVFPGDGFSFLGFTYGGFAPDAGHYPEMANFANPGQIQLFFYLYFVMTSLHALHMLIGFGIIIWLMISASKGYFGPRRYLRVEFFGLYWHFVDIVWVFIFPMFYLVT